MGQLVILVCDVCQRPRRATTRTIEVTIAAKRKDGTIDDELGSKDVQVMCEPCLKRLRGFVSRGVRPTATTAKAVQA